MNFLRTPRIQTRHNQIMKYPTIFLSLRSIFCILVNPLQSEMLHSSLVTSNTAVLLSHRFSFFAVHFFDLFNRSLFLFPLLDEAVKFPPSNKERERDAGNTQKLHGPDLSLVDSTNASETL